jgi:NitT/TauT family transport system permease protein
MRGRAIRLVATPVVFGLLLVVIWEGIVLSGTVPSYVIPSPADVVQQIGGNLPLLIGGTWISGSNALVGLLAGTVIAFAVALLANRFSLVDQLMSPLSAGAAAIPIVALAPLFYGMYSATSEFPRQLVVSVVVFFPVFVNVSKGMKQIQPVHRDLMRAYAASGSAFARFVQIPTALPFLFGGLRVAAPAAVITSIVSEYFGGGQNGLASLITNAASNTDYAQAWAFVAASVFLGLVFFLITAGLEFIVDRAMGAVR